MALGDFNYTIDLHLELFIFSGGQPNFIILILILILMLVIVNNISFNVISVSVDFFLKKNFYVLTSLLYQCVIICIFYYICIDNLVLFKLISQYYPIKDVSASHTHHLQLKLFLCI